MARLVQVRYGQLVYGCSAVDLNGRVADRAVFGALDWPVGTRLEIRESGGLIVVCADPQGVFRVTGRDRLLIPAAARQWCRLSPGDRVLLAADPVGRRLVVYPPAVLDVLVGQALDDAFGGDGR